MNTARKGFTLIELMVVITIIAILSTIALFGMNKAQASARDTERQQIMNGIRSALERYYADNQQYPDPAAAGALNFGGLMDVLQAGTYLTATDPTDPRGGCTTAIPATGAWLPCAGASPPQYAYTAVVAANCPGSSTTARQGYELVLTKESSGTSYFCSPN